VKDIRSQYRHLTRRDHLRALAQRVEVDAKEVRIVGAKSALLRTLVAASSAKTAMFGVPSFVPKWRASINYLARETIWPGTGCPHNVRVLRSAQVLVSFGRGAVF
jgi:hypothetical protein